MNAVEAEQGSPEWFEQRLGMVTASRLSDVMTKDRSGGGFGKTAYSYMYDLLAEKLTGKGDSTLNMYALEWGSQHENQAVATYSLRTGVRAVKAGFEVHSKMDGVGGSPDALCECPDDGLGGAEIKCPLKSRIHLQYLLEDKVPKEYYHQVQGLMWITGRKWWDFVSYDSRMPAGLEIFVTREHADPDLHDEYHGRVGRFIEQMNIKMERLKSYGN